MPAARKPASGKVWPTISLSFNGVSIPMDADLRDILPADVLAGVLDRGEGSVEQPS